PQQRWPECLPVRLRFHTSRRQSATGRLCARVIPRRAAATRSRVRSDRADPQDFRFDTKATEVTTPVQTFFEKRRGVCQDFAHLQVACMRSLGLPARYVSGYLRTTPPPGRARLAGADASHAWCSASCPGVGWVDFDPTNDCVPSDSHITLAWGRDYSDVSPIHGVLLGGARHTLHVGVDVMPIAPAGSSRR